MRSGLHKSSETPAHCTPDTLHLNVTIRSLVHVDLLGAEVHDLIRLPKPLPEPDPWSFRVEWFEARLAPVPMAAPDLPADPAARRYKILAMLNPISLPSSDFPFPHLPFVT